jgi:hypothetical protein
MRRQCRIAPVSRRTLLTSALAAVILAIGLWLARPAPITAVDQEQPRLSLAAPVPSGPKVLTQTIVAGHDGFSAIDLVAVVYPDNPPTAVLTVQVLNAAGHMIAQRDFKHLAHNAPVQINFPPQLESAGQTYWVRLSGSAGNQATVWSYGLDGYTPGRLDFNGQPLPGDLRFSTTYTYLWASLVRDSVNGLGRLLVMAVPLALVLWLPGALLLDVLGTGLGWLRVAGARLSVAVGLSVTLLALAWLWAGVVGWHWSSAGLSSFYVVIGFLAIARWLARLRSRPLAWPRPGLHDLGLAGILLAGLVLRLLAARDLAFPAWVDSSHHVLVARLLEAAGQVPANYQTALPVGVFYYHFAFHALVVTLHWLTGQSLVDTTLFLGQVLNALVALSAYCLAWGLTGRRRAGLAAAFVVALVSFFPGYFVTWGRYTQLTGLVIVGPAAAMLWRAFHPRPMLGRGPAGPMNTWRPVILAALLAAGVFLAHYRVLFFFVVFALVAWVAHLRQRQAWRALGLATAGALLVSLPWVVRLVSQAILPLLGVAHGLASAEAYNAFPSDYFTSSLERGWLALALLSGLWGLLRRDRGVWAVLAWTAGVFAGLNSGPTTWLVNNNSWAISLFLPGSVLLGWGADRWWHQARVWLAGNSTGWLPWRRLLGAIGLAAAAGLAGFAGLAGARTQLTVLNPATILATAADRQALGWLDAHLPANAVIAVNGWNWLAGLWAGSDGGAWILPITGRQTTLPPNDYAYGAPAYQATIAAFNAQLVQATDAATPAFRSLLHAAGVTHIFIGARGGPLKPEMFVSSPYYHLLYTNGADWIFAVTSP